MTSFEQLKYEYREIEKELESRLEDLEKIFEAIDPDNFEVTSEKRPEILLKTCVERLLEQAKQVCIQMQRVSTTHIEKLASNNYFKDQKIA